MIAKKMYFAHAKMRTCWTYFGNSIYHICWNILEDVESKINASSGKFKKRAPINNLSSVSKMRSSYITFK